MRQQEQETNAKGPITPSTSKAHLPPTSSAPCWQSLSRQPLAEQECDVQSSSPGIIKYHASGIERVGQNTIA